MIIFFVISNFRHVLNVVFFLLGDSLASEFYVSTFGDTVSSIFIGGVKQEFSCFTPPMIMERTGRSETSPYKIQTPGNHSKEIIPMTTFSVAVKCSTGSSSHAKYQSCEKRLSASSRFSVYSHGTTRLTRDGFL